MQVVRARARCQDAPLPDRVAPRRREHSAITGAEVGVLIVAIRALRPNTLEYPYPAPSFW